jgi:hypothetical protein
MQIFLLLYNKKLMAPRLSLETGSVKVEERLLSQHQLAGGLMIVVKASSASSAAILLSHKNNFHNLKQYSAYFLNNDHAVKLERMACCHPFDFVNLLLLP